MIVETVFALLMIIDHEIKEHLIQPNLSSCLKGKRIASRELNPERVVFSCKIVKAKVEVDEQTKYGKRIVKVLDE